MSLYSDPPPLLPFTETKPTLLVCWWITIFCTVIILLRVGGRFVRSERLFVEDRVAALALIPLYLRMGCVHVILIYGTNNAQLADANLSDDDIRKKSIASGLVLLSRIFYAATLWVLKNTILEFFRRLNVSWQRSYEVTLKIIRGTLIATFVAVVISDLAECQPFSHYWQVLPDPGGRCRQGYAQLLTLAVCNVLTDLLLVIFPIPIILRSGLTVKRKAELILLFSLSLIVVATTIYRVPHIIEDHGSQRSRSLYASVELLFATAAANTLVLGSFVRDRGVKKMKFKYGSVAAGSVDRSSASESRRPTLNKHWGSLEDLARDTGFGVQPELQKVDSPTNRRFYMPTPVTSMPDGMDTWRFSDQTQVSVAQSHDPLAGREQQSARRDSSNRRVTFFDVGGLLDDQDPGRRDSHTSTSDPSSPQSIPAPTIPASARGFRRGSTAFLQDIGGLFSSPTPKPDLPKPKEAAESAESPRTRRQSLARSFSASAYPAATGNAELELMDPGGLLNEDQHE